MGFQSFASGVGATLPLETSQAPLYFRIFGEFSGELHSLRLHDPKKRLSRLESRSLQDSKEQSDVRDARKELAEEFASVVPNSLAVARLRRGLSQAQLAETLQTSQSHIAKIEAGKVRLYFATAMRLADALSLSLDQLRTLVPVDELRIVRVGAKTK